jgi:hypothetical protein
MEVVGQYDDRVDREWGAVHRFAERVAQQIDGGGISKDRPPMMRDDREEDGCPGGVDSAIFWHRGAMIAA